MESPVLRRLSNKGREIRKLMLAQRLRSRDKLLKESRQGRLWTEKHKTNHIKYSTQASVIHILIATRFTPLLHTTNTDNS